MNILIIGNGGREHAIAWKLSQSPRASKIYIAPGNGGTAQIGQNIDIAADDINALLTFALNNDIGLTVVGPEAPLVAGIVDIFSQHGLRIFGPNASAARLEGSKVYAKQVMTSSAIPTADYTTFTIAAEAVSWLNTQPVDKGWVVKADGNAAGKGVLICDNRAEAIDAVNLIMVKREFGSAGDQILIEERLAGYEVSLLAICSGKDILALAPAQDYKRIGDGDTGPNTGGMGNYSPVPNFSPELVQFVIEKVITPTLNSVPFTGVLFVGLMITENGPQVLEYNVRFGDPETQVVLPRMKNDLLEIFEAAIDGQLASITPQWSNLRAVTVVMAAGGYPGDYKNGEVISGLPQAAALPKVIIFHAGTRQQGENLLTNGGRILNVTALGENFSEAIDRAYQAVKLIHWPACQYRHDIAARVKSD